MDKSPHIILIHKNYLNKKALNDRNNDNETSSYCHCEPNEKRDPKDNIARVMEEAQATTIKLKICDSDRPKIFALTSSIVFFLCSLPQTSNESEGKPNK